MIEPHETARQATINYRTPPPIGWGYFRPDSHTTSYDWGSLHINFLMLILIVVIIKTLCIIVMGDHPITYKVQSVKNVPYFTSFLGFQNLSLPDFLIFLAAKSDQHSQEATNRA